MTETPEPDPASALRASDRDRDEAAAQLRIHYAEGRISLDELEGRLEGVVAARTTRDIAGVVHDLPAVGEPARELKAPQRARVGPPGLLPFTHSVVVPAPREETRALALDKIAPGLHANGYELVSQSANGLVFERLGRPGWALAVAIFLFPIGLLALSQRKVSRLVISLTEDTPRRTSMTAYGTAPRGVRRAFADLTFS